MDRLNLKIKQGEVFGLLGPNGAGKTTTLMMLATLLKPSGGKALVNGYNVMSQAPEVRESIGIVFQEPSSDDLLTGYENLELHALMYGVPRSAVKERIKDALELVDLTDRKNDIVKKYSGGMRRRLEIARGLLHKPKVLFLDEPTLGLDPQTREHMWSYIDRLVKEEKVTIIITTHYMDEAEKLCDRVAIVDHGKIVVLDSPDKLKRVLGGDIIKMKIKKPNIKAVEKLKYVKLIDHKNNTVLLTVKDANLHLPEILKSIGKVESVELHSPTLNDVFLHYTGRDIREDSAEGGFWERAMNYRAKK